MAHLKTEPFAMCQATAMAAAAASSEELCSEQTLAQKHTARISLCGEKNEKFFTVYRD